MNTLPTPRPLVVIILDGWGISFVQKGNAITAAKTPMMTHFALSYPTAAILAAGIEVGLPWGEVGNSETGHSNIGAGDVQYQPLPKIDKAIEDGSFFKNRVLLDAIAHVSKNKSQLHLMGLIGPGGVHAHSNHLYALLELIRSTKVRDQTFIHAFTDGRDSPPQSAIAHLQALENTIGKYGVGRIASVTGRLYAMDRNLNWERTQQTYNMLTGGPRGAGASSPSQAVQQWYDQGIYDEMLPPTAMTRGGGPIAVIKENDAVIFFNFRPDRARQLTRAFVDKEFTGFDRIIPENIYFATLYQYDKTLPAPAAFIDLPSEQPLARIISEANLRQLHIAETEKYAHVTYYLNGGHEDPFPQEKHVLVESSRVKNFAQEPHMAASAITDHILQEIKNQSYEIYFVNYANADMVGHTGNYEATVEACSFVDTQLRRLYDRVVLNGGALLITADHGNAEEMLNPQTGSIQTDHSSNPVPLHYVNEQLRHTPRSEAEMTSLYSSPIGVLADIAPTILDILNIDKPTAMTGISLLSSLQ